MKRISLLVVLSLCVGLVGAGMAQEDTKKDDSKEKWKNTTWKKIGDLTKQKRTFQVEKATTVAGVRGAEAEDAVLKQLYYRGGGDYPSRLELKTAIDILQKSVRMDPDAEDASESLFFIGQCYAQLGEPDKAMLAFQRVVAEYPDAESAKLAKEEVDRRKQ